MGVAGTVVKRVVKLKQIISHLDALWAIDIDGNLWYHSRISGWEAEDLPIVEEFVQDI